MKTEIRLLLCALLNTYIVSSTESIPIVIWHGMGDSCCNPISIGSFKKFLGSKIENLYAHSLQIGDSMKEDIWNSFFMNTNKQIEYACEKIKNDSRLMNGYNSIGFSQGGQFLRAVAQRCPSPPMKNLISIGGQHQGVFGMPKCIFGHFICEAISHLLDHGAYTDYVQNSLVQAQYWHDPLNETEYKMKSIFLADINNEKVINESYKTNLAKLDNFVMVKFTKDTMVVPPESEWFGFYQPGQDEKIDQMNETALYREDRLGLASMNQQGKLHFLPLDSDHLRFTEEWFSANIIDRFLK